MEVVKLQLPETQAMLDTLDKLRTRVEAGEFASLLILAFKPNGQFLTVERGKRMSRLETIGLMECIKQDLLDTMTTPEELDSL